MKKIVIVGGGIAGLSAGIFAQINGFESEIYEKNVVAGGQCMGWDRKNHHIDNCIHWLTGTKKDTDLYKLWETLGAINDDTEMVELDQFYTSEHQGNRITLWRDLEKTKSELLKLSPADKDEIEKFISAVKSAECCEVPIKKPMDMMNIIDYIELGKKMSGMGMVMKEYGKISVEEFANRFQHPLLRKLFCDYMPKDYNASSFIVSYAIMVCGNGNIPKQGSLAMTNRIIEKYKSLGGKLYLQSPVQSIVIENGISSGIMLESGIKINADYVICSTDTYETFYKLIDQKYIDKNFEKCYQKTQDYPIFTAFQMAFSVDKDCYHGDVTFFDCKPFMIGNKSINRMSLKSYYYEDSFAPTKKIVIQSNVMQRDEDYLYWSSLSKEEYKRVKQKVADDVMKSIIDYYPQLEGHIELLDCWTPLTYTRYCNSFHGAYMAFVTKPNIKAPKVSCKIKKLANVFIGSQWLQSPGGLPTAAASGKFAIQHILKKEHKSIHI